MQIQHQRSRANRFLTFFLVMTSIAFALLTGYFFVENGDLEASNNNIQDTVVDLRKKVDSLEAEASTLEEDAQKAQSSADEAISTSPIQAAKAFFAAQQASPLPHDKYKAELIDQSNPFKRYIITAPKSTTKTYVVVKKVDTLWIGVTSGTQLPTNEEGKRFLLPNGWYST